MEPVQIQLKRPQHARELVNLDEAEMSLELLQLDAAASVAQPELVMTTDWLSELNSCASMIMDREEREALALEIELALKHHPVAA